MPKPVSPSELARQRKLDSYRIVDTLPEAVYDDIVRIASVLCGVPTALMTLVDHDRQWFKARVGLEARETPRDIAFCDRAIQAPERPLVVEDALLDTRFADNPLVTGETGIRFYAGVPLRAPTGEALGTVCVIDRIPRTLHASQIAGLEALARVTVTLMEAHRDRLMHERDDAMRAVGVRQPVDAEAARGSAGAVAIVRVVDHDAFGETFPGDDVAALLAIIAPAMRGELGAGDIVGPHGDHELLLVLADMDDAGQRFERIHHAASAAAAATGARAAGCITIGAAVAATSGQAMEDLFLRADDALTQARAAGGDRVVVVQA